MTSPVRGKLVCPPDKSVTHRSLIFAGMAAGDSEIENPLLGADCRSTMGVMTALGVQCVLAQGGSRIKVSSPGWAKWRSPLAPLDFGNSGTTARLMTGVLAATPGLFAVAYGDQSLSKRPMGRVVKPLRAAGATIDGREDGGLLPLSIRGQQLKALAHTVDKASAQVKSALLLAGMNVEGKTTVTLPRGGRDHTEKMLQALGAKVSVSTSGAAEVIELSGPVRVPAGRFRVPGDPSSAAFFAVLAAIGGEATILGVLDNPTRTGFLTVLERMGVDLERRAQPLGPGQLEPIMDLTVKANNLRGVDVEPELAPSLIDEIPILAVAAAFATGKSRFRGLGELRVKESDRLAMTVGLITAAGGKAHAEGDDLIVDGGLGIGTIKGFSYDPDQDHRLAMSAAVLGRFATSAVTVRDPECVDVSFPGFFDVLAEFK